MGWQRGARAALVLAGAIAFAACGSNNGTTDVPTDTGGGGGGGESSGGGAGGGGGTTSTGGGGGGGGSIVTDHDAGTPIIDSGTPDAGHTETDAGVTDAGTPDAGTGFQFGTPGPWAVSNVVYGAANGIQESPVVGITTDESQNIWVATHSALYLLKPGQVTFKRFSSANGLHLSDNPAYYDDSHITDAPAGSSHVAGAAVSPGIMEVVGGGPNEVFLGYAGLEDGDGTIADAARHSGKIDQVKLNADGSITVNRFDLVANQHGMFFWHNRTVYRMVYDHFIHPHTLYAGTNHGVDMLLPDLFVGPPANGSYPDTDSYYLKWMGDHLHARVCYHMTCPQNSEEGQRMGEWRGLALDAAGDLWHAGRWTAGAITWDPAIKDWYMRGGNAFKAAFGDPYNGPNDTNGNGFANEPVFKVPQEGDAVSLSSVTVAPDGKVWFASEPWYGTGIDATPYGIANWDGHKFTVIDPVGDLGAPEKLVHDLVALPDGRIAIGFTNSGLLFYDPATGGKKWIHGGSGIADDHITRMSLDTMVNPPALHVSTNSGAAVIRVMPQ
ncbi:MAG: WD40 repeat domain-containing protein [Myxococcaceae bacterium]